MGRGLVGKSRGTSTTTSVRLGRLTCCDCAGFLYLLSGIKLIILYVGAQKVAFWWRHMKALVWFWIIDETLHMHMLVYTLWCWHTLRRRWSLKGRERMGSSLPPAELARRDSALFKKMKCIFSIAPVGKLEKSRECFSLTGHWPRGTGRCVCASVGRQCSTRLGLSNGR